MDKDLNIDEEESLSQDRPPRNQGFLFADFEKDKFEARRKNLAERFVVPPFSVLDARQGYWQQGKQLWFELGIKSELGRDENLTFKGNVASFDYYRVKEGIRKESDIQSTLIFDPVLCEIIYKWFCHKGGSILDPFAGGSVRGIVAEYLGYKYTGIELRPEQIEANKKQAGLLKLLPRWIIGDSEIKLDDLQLECFDFLFSCPPYFNLEIYSDLPGELSAYRKYNDFLDKYKNIIKKACNLLKKESFGCFVVSNIRDKKTGYLYSLVGDTIEIFHNAGMVFYNEAILIKPCGSLPMRVAKQFEASRKLGKMHQNILIFKKG